MFLDDTTFAGVEWLFGSTRSIKSSSNGKKIVLWKLKLDTLHNPDTSTTRSLSTNKVDSFNITANGYIVGIKPKFDTAGSMHLIWNDDNLSLYYMIFSWPGFLQKYATFSSKLLY